MLSFWKSQARFSGGSGPAHPQTLLFFLPIPPRLSNVSSRKPKTAHPIFRHSFYAITSKNLLTPSLCLAFDLQRAETTNRTSSFHTALSRPGNHKSTTATESNANP